MRFVMNKIRRHTFWAPLAVLILAVAMVAPVKADLIRTQTINLHKGWNSIFLQVTPANTNADAVFAGTPISIVTTYFGANSTVEFIQNPGTIKWKQDGWGAWYAPGRPDSFLSSLAVIHGNRPYLVYSQQDFTWTVQGTASFQRVRWKSNSFNLVGFCLDDQSPPTFAKFFAGSAAHKPYKIYQLVNDQWTQVIDPVRTTMKSGEAYWVYCTGTSDYQGPLMTKLASSQGIVFGENGEAWISLSNQSTDPMSIKVETISSDVGLPLAYTIRGVSPGHIQDVTLDLPQTYQLDSLEAGQTTGFWLKLRREKLTQTIQTTLLKISTDNGVQVWVPVTGAQSDLPASP
jgi:hypothetical protein